MDRTTCTLWLMYTLFSFKSKIQTKAIHLMDCTEQRVSYYVEFAFKGPTYAPPPRFFNLNFTSWTPVEQPCMTNYLKTSIDL